MVKVSFPFPLTQECNVLHACVQVLQNLLNGFERLKVLYCQLVKWFNGFVLRICLLK